MSEKENHIDSQWSDELEATLENLRNQMLQHALLVVGISGILILTATFNGKVDPVRALFITVGIEIIVLVARSIVSQHYLLSSSLLVLGSFLFSIGATFVLGVPEFLYFLVIPVGFASVLISRRAGSVIGVVCTIIVFLLPVFFPVLSTLNHIALCVCIWFSFILVWITLNPLLTTVHWAWYGYEHNAKLLHDSREHQERLSSTLEELSGMNVQLRRLNSLAQSLRQIAEEERQSKEQFVANVSHELRTPLNMIVGYIEMITKYPQTYGRNLPPTLLADLAVVLRNSQHLSSLVDDVLDLSQLNSGQMSLSKERVPFTEIIQSAVKAIQPLYEFKKLFLDLNIQEDIPFIYCDRIRIREVFLNLLSNSGRFTEKGGVTIRIWTDQKDVITSVSDTGPGITDEDQKRLFQPFQQLDGSIRRRYGGTGLGLSISKNFIELHNGRMWVESEFGKGTTFYFRLPIDPPTPMDDSALRWFSPYQPLEPRSQISQVHNTPVLPRLLVIEKDGILLRLLKRHLESVELSSVSNIHEAVQEHAKNPCQALIINESDANLAMDEINQIGELPYGIPIIITAIQKSDREEYDRDIAGYLIKPINRDDLLTAIERVGNVKSVLIVDDEREALQLFRRMLSTGENIYQVYRATNGQQAIEVLKTKTVDLILLDLVMPEMDGFQFLAVRNQNPDWSRIPVILISAQDPSGHPIVSKLVAFTYSGGISASRLIASINSLRLLSTN